MKKAVLSFLLFMLSINVKAVESFSSRFADYDSILFGNPALTMTVENNQLATIFSIENYRYDALPELLGFQLSKLMAFDTSPSISYTRSFGNKIVTLGYSANLVNRFKVKLSNTQGEYAIDDRQFRSTTHLLTDYSLSLEESWKIAMAMPVDDRSRVGLRLKFVSEQSKQGEVLLALNLQSEHASDINVNDPQELISAIIDGFDFSEPGKYIDRTHNPESDLTVGGLDLEFGYERTISIGQNGKEIDVGLFVEDLFHRKRVKPVPLTIGFDAAYDPLKWLTVEMHISRVSWQKGFNRSIAVEFHKDIFSSSIASNFSLSKVDGNSQFSLGAGIQLGSSCWKYSIVGNPDNSFDKLDYFFASIVNW